MKRKVWLLVFLAFVLFPSNAWAQGSSSLIDLQIGSKGDLSSSVQVFVLVTLLGFLPSLFIMTTTYAKFVIILSLTRNALGTMTSPPNMVINGLAIYLTIFVMAPVFTNVYEEAYVPYTDNKLEFKEAVKKAEKPVKHFLLANSDDEHIALSVKLAKVEKPASYEETPFRVAVLSHTFSMLQDALLFAAIILIIFAVVDMIVAAVLMLLGMFMLPPVTISLPIKILTFLAAGGFALIVEAMVGSVNY